LNFNGFSKASIDFLVNIKKNNNKEWFHSNKHLYDNHLLKPFQNLVIDLTECMLDIDSHFEVMPFVNRTISRIYRDTRFSKDKTLYRNVMWIMFKKKSKKNNWRNTPTFFFELTPDFYRYGMGFYCAKKSTMDLMRATIDKDIKSFAKLIQFNKDKRFEILGDMYVKSLNEKYPDEIKFWYDRKNIYIIYSSDKLEEVYSSNLVDIMITDFKILAPVYKFFSSIEEKMK